MPLASIKIPAGVRAHGTEFESANRWLDVNLVRWRDGSMRPIGGWTTRAESAVAAPPRGAVSWIDNSDVSRLATGTYNKLYYVSPAGSVSDITPVGLTAGNIDAQLNIGYGGSFYGSYTYGTTRPNTGVYLECTTWSLDNWGEYLVACSVDDGKLYEWQLNAATPAAQISNSPSDCVGLMVTEERFLFALGAGGNPRLVQWCDKQDNTTWTPSATNEAGDFELQTNGEILCGLRARGRALILTTTDAHAATYIGPQLVYSFERVGTSCGAISRKAAVSFDQGSYWMGTKGFYMFDGSAVREMPCEVIDHVFNNMNTAQRSKIFAVHNSQFGEVWWFYPSKSSNENDSYVIYDYKENHWNIGLLNRTTGVDAGVFRNPIWLDEDGNMYNHEDGFDHGTYESYAESGPILIGDGDAIAKINQLIPDELTQGQVTVSFKTRFHPNDTERSYGPYSTANPTDVRFTGRQFRMRINGSELNNWRFGIPRLNIISGGRR
jgi:hypothetical protein